LEDIKNHRKLFRSFVIAIAIILSGTAVKAQIPTVQDCLGAIPICQNVYSTSTSYHGMGNYPNEIPWASCLNLGGESNSVWYTFTVQTSGIFRFVLTPNSGSDDYDWGLFNLTNSSCPSLYSNFYSLIVSCNASGNTGTTGISTPMGGTGNNNGPGGTNKFNADLNVVAGQTYVLMISNWSNGYPGYSINFGSSTAQIFDNVPPKVAHIISTINCGATSLTFDFSENILCSTISTCDLTLSGPGGPYTITSVSGAACTMGGNQEKIFTITFSPAITTGGTFNLSLVPANCGSVTDLCGNVGLAGSLPFTINLPMPSAGPDLTVCAGSSVTLTGSGCTNCTYTWNNGVINGVPFVPATTTTYTVTGISPQGCSGTDAMVVTVTPLPVPNPGPPQSVCAGQSVTLTASGGTTYNWSGGVVNGVPFVPSTTTTYTVTVSNGSCSATSSVLVTVNPAPIANAGPDQAICAGGTVTLNGSGGGTYTWNNGVTNGVPFTPAGTTTYTVTVTNTSTGCTATDAVLVTINALPVPNAGPNQTICAGASVILSGSGCPNCTYSWNNGINNGVPFVPSSTNTYTVTATNPSGCSATDDVVVTVDPLPVANAGNPQSICAGQSVTLTATGGSTYVWNNGVINGVPFVPSSTTTYTVTVSNGSCSATSSVQVTVNPLPAANAGPDVAVCAGLSVTLSGSGGGTYAWSNGVINGVAFAPAATATYTVTVTDTVTGCAATDDVLVTVNPVPVVNAGPDLFVCTGSSVTLTASGCPSCSYSWNNGVMDGVPFVPAASGTYLVWATDPLGCTDFDAVVITVNPLPPANAGNPQTVCAGQSVTLTATGGSTYVWNNSVINGVSFIPLSTNTYSVTVSAGNCSATSSVTVTVNALPVANAGPDKMVCSGDSVILSGSGGGTYLWDNGITDGVAFAPPVTSNYTVTVTDNVTGCWASDQALVVVYPLPPASAGPNQMICIGGSVTLNGSGGTTYLWDNGVTNGISFTPAATNTYTVTVTDNNGCSSTSSVLVTVSVPMTIIFTTTDEHCGKSDGSATAIVSGGSGNFSYVWNTASPQFTQTLSNVHAGNYTVTVTSNGCTSSATVSISNVPAPTVVISGTINETCGLNDGSATVSASGGSGTYTYLWSCFPPQTSPVMVNVHAGNYTVTVADSFCSVTVSAIIHYTPPPVLQISAVQPTCGQANGSATVTVTGGSNTYTYLWNNGKTTASINNIPSGVYHVAVDDGDCVVKDSVRLIDLPGPAAGFSARPENLTLLDGPVKFHDNSSGDIVYWHWNFGDGTPYGSDEEPSHQYGELGTFIITLYVTDINGCHDTASDTITIREIFTFYIPSAFTPDENGLNDLWGPKFLGISRENYLCVIYNRWGELIFRTSDPYTLWNGTKNNNGSFKNIVSGVYVYYIRVQEEYGLLHEFTGTITIPN
jgi:gliding motility-associated-like protein